MEPPESCLHRAARSIVPQQQAKTNPRSNANPKSHSRSTKSRVRSRRQENLRPSPRQIIAVQRPRRQRSSDSQTHILERSALCSLAVHDLDWGLKRACAGSTWTELHTVFTASGCTPSPDSDLLAGRRGWLLDCRQSGHTALGQDTATALSWRHDFFGKLLASYEL
jgi:hypothetical protein